MAASMASASIRAVGVAPRASKPSKRTARVATQFGSTNAAEYRTLGDAMVAAAAKFGPKHQAEVKAALDVDNVAPSAERRDFLKKALLGVRAGTGVISLRALLCAIAIYSVLLTRIVILPRRCSCISTF